MLKNEQKMLRTMRRFWSTSSTSFATTFVLPFVFFFFNDTATTEIYTLSLHDALPISSTRERPGSRPGRSWSCSSSTRSEEHTSELQSHSKPVCRLLLEKKKKKKKARPVFRISATVQPPPIRGSLP